jgi:hypothetical protein
MDVHHHKFPLRGNLLKESHQGGTIKEGDIPSVPGEDGIRKKWGRFHKATDMLGVPEKVEILIVSRIVSPKLPPWKMLGNKVAHNCVVMDLLERQYLSRGVPNLLRHPCHILRGIFAFSLNSKVFHIPCSQGESPGGSGNSPKQKPQKEVSYTFAPGSKKTHAISFVLMITPETT